MKKFLLLFCFLLLPMIATAGPSIREHLVEEPVFGHRAFILEAGQSKQPTVLLVHGLGDLASGTWEKLIPALASEYHVLAVDLPGFGRSEKANELYSPARYAAFLHWALERYASGPLIVVGHSLGGAVALRYAADYPQDISRLILVDVAGILHRKVVARDLLEPKLSERWPGLFAGPLKKIENWVGGVITRLPGPPLDLDQILVNEALRARFLAGDPARIAAIALIQEDFSRTLRQVQAPAALVWGAEDQVTPLRTGLLLESILPRARLQVIPGAGHVPMKDQPRLFSLAFQEALTSPLDQTEIPEVGDRTGVCRGQKGMTFSGAYRRLEITDCREVRLDDVAAEAVSITRSQVNIEQGQIRGRGLQVIDSSLSATGLRVEGDVALQVAGGQLDLAGVTLIGQEAAITATKPTTMLFSVSEVQSRKARRFLHGLYTMDADHPM